MNFFFSQIVSLVTKTKRFILNVNYVDISWAALKMVQKDGFPKNSIFAQKYILGS